MQEPLDGKLRMQGRGAGLWLVVLASLVLLPGVLSPRDFTISDEARYADVMRGMRDEGHWIVPYLNGSFYADKPPVFFWLARSFSNVRASSRSARRGGGTGHSVPACS